ncbi:serine/threonine-protein kinase [Tomitella cavernea]|uniref:non-specific serine/threonine protein kinase n=1 Tax=Tomitella cavernea TaxID=1387982 RepID=A0ABP9CBD4_9ACTN|nr:serine/threonine-protein kinase [Tomitella cavernea]
MTGSSPSPHVAGPDYLVAGRYRLQSRLGGGGMGTVWLARDVLLDREVALKQIADTVGLQADRAESLRTRALHEGRVLSKLTGPHITRVFDVTLDQGAPWIVLEYVPSCSLAQVLHMTGTLPPQQAAQIGAQVADAMTEAHGAGILHRDIKPGNILIADRGTTAGVVKISDFGIARAAPAAEPAAVAGFPDPAGVGEDVIVGTPAYFAPEIARGHTPTTSSDVFSLGAALYTAIEGLPPFGVDEDHAVVLHNVARGEVTAPLSEHPAMGVVLAMLEPDPARRPTMAEARDRLAHVAAGDELDPGLMLTSPLLAPDGRIPVWVRRAGGIRQRSKAVPGSTVGGLIAVQHATPLDQVRKPDNPALATLTWGAQAHAEPARIHADASSRVPRHSTPATAPGYAWFLRAAIVAGIAVVLVLILVLLVTSIF